MRLKTLLVPTLLVAVFAVLTIIQASDERSMAAAKREAVRARHEKADAIFRERCKKAGEFTYRTAEDVEGVFLLKLRPDEINYRDQYRMDDPYGRDLGGDGYILSFLRGFETRQAQFAPGSPNRYGYFYVDAIDPVDGKRYRYTGSVKEVTHTESILIGGDGKTKFKTMDFVLDRIPAPDPAPRYGVTYDDISTREERDYWIAGSSLKVIDLQTNEVMAERIGYMMDRGQGSDSGGRAPWLFAADHACPGFQRNPNHLIRSGHGASAQQIQTEDFVEKILKPKMEK
jgi:hypothetical protein